MLRIIIRNGKRDFRVVAAALFLTVVAAVLILWRRSLSKTLETWTLIRVETTVRHFKVDGEITNVGSEPKPPYVIPKFCDMPKKASLDGRLIWPSKWSYNMSRVPTSLRTMDNMTRDALTRDIAGIKPTQTEIKAIREYRDCRSESDSKTIACDKDCQRLLSLFSAWPVGKPKAVIHFLINSDHMDKFPVILNSLDTYFNNQFKYPIILFTDDTNLTIPAARELFKNMTKSDVFIQFVSFELPPYVRPEVVPRVACKAGVGYRHMCRFMALQIYEQAILKDVEFVWRLDTDSRITRKINYDIFQRMRDNNIDYGYVRINTDSCSRDMAHLWKVTCKYIIEESWRTEFFHDWFPLRMFYNNFEISAMSVWRSCAYRNYIDYIDRLGGIYYYRWGDHIIKSIALSLFVPWERVHHFNDIGYKHQHFNQ